jgi:hypothetical protein
MALAEGDEPLDKAFAAGGDSFYEALTGARA